MGAQARYLDRLAELAIGFGANVQPGQVVIVAAEVGQEAYVRAGAAAAYRRGAKYVQAEYFDPHVKHARLLHADRETLTYVPDWVGRQILESGELHSAIVQFYGDTEPDLMNDIEPELLGLDLSPLHKEVLTVINDRSVSWAMVPAVTPAWAQTVYPELDPDAAVEALWESLAVICRLSEPDPVAAWEQRFAELSGVADRLDALDIDSLHFSGPGTDLRVGLLPGSRFKTAQMTTAWGQPHHVNLPSEEVFTTPDPERTEGYVTATRPLLVSGAAPVQGLRVRFEAGRAVSFEAESGGAGLEAMAHRDAGGVRLGEVALVDRESRVGQSGRVFNNILLDENAASHIALGNGYVMPLVDDDSRARMNVSEIHIDFMIGSDAVDVTATTRAGVEQPLLRDGAWVM